MVIAPNTILTPESGTQLIESPHRVLVVDSENDKAWIISLRRQTMSGTNKPYMTRPIALALSAIEAELKAGSLKIGQFDQPPHWALSDADYLSSAPNEKERGQRKSRQKRRDATWESISPNISCLSRLAPIHAACHACEKASNAITHRQRQRPRPQRHRRHIVTALVVASAPAPAK